MTINKIKITTDEYRKVWAIRPNGAKEHILTLGKRDTLRRASRWKLIHWHNGERTLYDLKHQITRTMED